MFVKSLSENREYAKRKPEKAELKDEKVDEVKMQIEKLKKKVASLEKFRNDLGQQEAVLKDHVREEQNKIKQFADDWAQKNLKVYADIEHQVRGTKHANKKCWWFIYCIFQMDEFMLMRTMLMKTQEELTNNRSFSFCSRLALLTADFTDILLTQNPVQPLCRVTSYEE